MSDLKRKQMLQDLLINLAFWAIAIAVGTLVWLVLMWATT